MFVVRLNAVYKVTVLSHWTSFLLAKNQPPAAHAMQIILLQPGGWKRVRTWTPENFSQKTPLLELTRSG